MPVYQPQSTTNQPNQPKEQTHRNIEEHITLLIQILEPLRIIRKLIPTIRRAGIPQKDTLHLIREFRDHSRIIAHHVAVTRISDKDELPLRKGLEDLLEQEFADRERGGDVGEVERSRVEGSSGVCLVDEVHVVAGYLLGGCGQVVEVEVWDRFRPIGVDLGHVHPRGERAGEGIQQPFFRLVDLGYAQDIVDVRDDGKAFVGNEEGGGIADLDALCVDIQTLQLRGCVAWCEAVVFDLHETVDVAFARGGDRKFDDLVAAAGCHCSSSARLTTCALSGCRGQREGYVLVALLEDVDFSREISSL